MLIYVTSLRNATKRPTSYHVAASLPRLLVCRRCLVVASRSFPAKKKYKHRIQRIICSQCYTWLCGKFHLVVSLYPQGAFPQLFPSSCDLKRLVNPMTSLTY